MPIIVLRIITSYEKGLLHWDLPLCGRPFPCSGRARCAMARFELAFLHSLYYNKEL